ncbi:MAG: hypothetical protein AB7V16_12940 [Vulcanibacillus sp.]
MGRKRLPPELRRENVTIRLPQYIIDDINKINNSINDYIEKLIIKDLKEKSDFKE